MKQTVIYPTLSAIVSGLVIALFGFYVLSTQPADPSRGVYITYFNADVSNQALQDFISKVVPGVNFKDDATIRKFKDSLSYGDDMNMAFYKIENTGDRAIPNFKVTLGRDFSFAYLSDQRVLVPITNDKPETDIILLPRSTATLTIISKFAAFEPNERFLVDGKEVWVDSKMQQIRDPFEDAFWFIKGNIGLALLLMGLGVFTVFGVLMAVLMFFFTRNNPDYLVKSTDNWIIVRCLTLLNIIRDDDPPRYSKILGKSEEQYSRWKSNNSKP